jgi:hypothetical protein
MPRWIKCRDRQTPIYEVSCVQNLLWLHILLLIGCFPDNNQKMASNINKVEEKGVEDLEKAIKSSKSWEEFERKLDPDDVSYKIKDETKEGRKQKYETNQ